MNYPAHNPSLASANVMHDTGYEKRWIALQNSDALNATSQQPSTEAATKE